ncbi:MAG: hypothetical protein ACSW8F_00470 [bacterium]
MGELDGMLSQLLSDPAQMQRIMGLARELSESAPQEEPQEKPTEEPPLLDPALLPRLMKLLRGVNEGDDKRALVEALKPYVAEEHRGDLDRAIKIARLARVAKLAMGEFGGDLGGLF